MARDLIGIAEAAGIFRASLVKRAKEAAPSVRIKLTLWNIDGRVVDADAQTLTVESNLCKERSFKVPTDDLMAIMRVDDTGRGRLNDLRAALVLALIGRSPSQ